LIAPLNDPPREALTITQHVVLRGLSLARVNPAVQVEMGLPGQAKGVVMTDAQDLAMRNGLKPGDILLGINGQPVDQPQDALTLAQQGGSRWQIEVVRAGQALHLRLRV
jgi:S1-C subfamily serine protease